MTAQFVALTRASRDELPASRRFLVLNAEHVQSVEPTKWERLETNDEGVKVLAAYVGSRVRMRGGELWIVEETLGQVAEAIMTEREFAEFDAKAGWST